MTDRNLSAGALTELAAANVEFYYLVRFDFSTPIYLTTAPRDITHDSKNYLSSGLLSKIPDFSESLKIKPQTISIDFSGATLTSHALPITNNFRNVDVYIYRYLVDSGDTFLVFKGYIDSYGSTEDAKKGTSKVSWNIANHWTDFDAATGRLLTDESQQDFYSGDLGLEFAGVTDPISAYWGDLKTWFEDAFVYYTPQQYHGSWDENETPSIDPTKVYDWTAGAGSEGRLPIVYGQASIKGTPVFRDIPDNSNEYLWVVYALAEGECHSLVDILFDGVSYDDPDIAAYLDTSLTTTSTYGGFYPGTTTQSVGNHGTGTDLESASTLWTTSHNLKGICCCIIRYKYDAEIWSGEPSPQFILKGKKCAPIGGGSAVWTQDPATILSDYLTNDTYGKGLATTDFDQFSEGETYCKSLVTNHSGGGAASIPRFQFNGVIDSSNPIKKNVESILFSMNASLPWVNGLYKLVINRHDDAASFTFNEDNITGAFNLKEQTVKDYANKIFYKYIDPDIDYSESTVFSAMSISDINTIDNGRRLIKTVTNKFETNRYRAQNRSSTILKQTRSGLRVTLESNKADSIRNETGDIINLTRATQGWTDKKFRIESMTMKADGNCKFALRQYEATNFDWNVGAEYTPPTGSSLPNPFSIEPPASVVLLSDETTKEALSDGTVINRLKVTITAPTNTLFTRYECLIRSDSDSTWTALPVIPDKTENVFFVSDVRLTAIYYIKVRCINDVGNVSSWVTDSETIIGDSKLGYNWVMLTNDSINNTETIVYNLDISNVQSVDYQTYLVSPVYIENNVTAGTMTAESFYLGGETTISRGYGGSTPEPSWSLNRRLRTTVVLVNMDRLLGDGIISFGAPHVWDGVGFAFKWSGTQIEIYGMTGDSTSSNTQTLITSVADGTELQLECYFRTGTQVEYTVTVSATEYTATITTTLPPDVSDPFKTLMLHTDFDAKSCLASYTATTSSASGNNLLTYSSDLTNAVWQQTNISRVYHASVGGYYELKATVAGAYVRQTKAKTSGSDVAFSFRWYQAGSLPYGEGVFTVEIVLTGGTTLTETVNIDKSGFNSTWFRDNVRCEVEEGSKTGRYTSHQTISIHIEDTGSNTSAQCIIYPSGKSTGDTTSSIGVSHLQLEYNTKVTTTPKLTLKDYYFIQEI